MSTIAVIPARYASTRLAEKLLLDLGGKSVLQRTYEQASQAKLITKVVIATDDERIFKHAEDFGAEVYMTSAEHQSGTDRIAELTCKNLDWNIIVNVQGDEPFINPNDIDLALEPFLHDPLCQMVSLYHEISDPEEINNPNNVKVVTDVNNNAMYFSRAAVPHDRDRSNKEAQKLRCQDFAPDARLASPEPPELTDASMRMAKDERNAADGQKPGIAKKHIGLYAYRRETLLLLAGLPQTQLEKLEKLEQLRALENGIKIKMLKVTSAPIGIDTLEDYEAAYNRVVLRHSTK